MFDPKQFDEVASKLFGVLPESFKNFEKDMHQRFKEILQATFARMDLVTRDEFDVQCKVLARTREKVETLEHKLAELFSENKK